MIRSRDRFAIVQRAASVFGVVLLVAGALQGCSKSQEGAPAKGSASATIEPVEGMKYYVGGPIMKFDQYGRMRLGGFNGEISTPTSRGLLLGFKKNADSTFDYRTWLNGAIITQSTGFLDKDGLLWYTERVSYDANGDITVRQKFEYNDEAKIAKSVLNHIDPESGEVVKTFTQETPYAPTEEEKAKMFEDDSEGEEEAPGE